VSHTLSLASLAFALSLVHLPSVSWKWSEERVGWQVRTLTGHSGWVNAVAFSPDSQFVVSGSADKLVKIWHTATGAEVSSFVIVR